MTGSLGSAGWRDGIICLAVANPRPITGLVVVVNTSIAPACLAHPNPLAALIGCIAFAGQRRLRRLFAAPDGCSITSGWPLWSPLSAVRLAMTGHPALAGVDWWLIVEVNVALPLGGQILVRALWGSGTRRYRPP